MISSARFWSLNRRFEPLEYATSTHRVRKSDRNFLGTNPFLPLVTEAVLLPSLGFALQQTVSLSQNTPGSTQMNGLVFIMYKTVGDLIKALQKFPLTSQVQADNKPIQNVSSTASASAPVVQISTIAPA